MIGAIAYWFHLYITMLARVSVDKKRLANGRFSRYPKVMIDFTQERAEMVASQLKRRGIKNTAVLRAMSSVPREIFVPEREKKHAYRDGPLPLIAGQTISQPYIVAWMISLLNLNADARVLEIGAGSGYAAAVLSRIVKTVYAVERHEQLIEYARQRLDDLHYDNVHLHHGDGTVGWAEYAPYDGILVSAGGPAVPPKLREQLGINGRLIIPVGDARHKQQIICITRLSQDEFDEKEYGRVVFVPLIGAQGWSDSD